MPYSKNKKIEGLLRLLDKETGRHKKSMELPQVDFSKIELSPPQSSFLAGCRNINLFLAGQGGGKTFMAGFISAVYIQKYPERKGLIAANTYAQLSGSTLYRIREVWRSFGWEEYNPYTGQGHYTVGVQPPDSFDTSRHNFENYRNIISFCNGAVLHYYSLDNYKPIDGLEIAYALLDETKDTRPAAITEVILGRLRQQPDSRLFVFTSPAKDPFLNEFFNLNEYEADIVRLIYSQDAYFAKATRKNMFVVISSALHNKHLPKDFIERQKSILPAHLQDMLIYGNPFAKQGGEFYKGFDRARHVQPLNYDPDLPLHISFDFNVHPYITLTVFQIAGKTARQIDEICLESPRNNTQALCREFKRRYPHRQAGLFVYGDPAGRHADTRNQHGYNDYTIILSELKEYKPKLRVSHKAPAVVPRANFINAIFEKELYGIQIKIDEKCRNTIADYLYLKEAADGSKLKQKEKKNGITYEKFGHCSDANDYLICEAFKEEFQRFLRGGEERRTFSLGRFIKNIHR